LLDRFLYQVGLNESQRQLLLQKHSGLVKRFYNEFSYLERMKTYRRLKRVADGVNRPAIFNARAILGYLPSHYLSHLDQWATTLVPGQELFSLMLSDHAEGRDKRLTSRLNTRLRRLQLLYKNVVKKISARNNVGDVLLALSERASPLNRNDRLTGNALIHVVDELLKARRRGFSDAAIQEVMTAVIADQGINVEAIPNGNKQLSKSPAQELLTQVLTLVQNHKEEI